LLQALQKRCGSSRRFRVVCGRTQQDPDAPHSLGLLRARGERPHNRRTAEQAD
jgi:hypothetical protein